MCGSEIPQPECTVRSSPPPQRGRHPCGFWQIPLSPASRLLTTFITPSERYCFNKLPFGISSAPENFQKRMSMGLAGLQGAVCQMDVVLVFGGTRAGHDTRLLAVLQRIKKTGVTLHAQKCEFHKTSIKFLGHVIDQNGIQADSEKTSAIRGMQPPTAVTELHWFMGMANQLGKFSPNLAQLTQPLRELLSKKTPPGPGERVKVRHSVKKSCQNQPLLHSMIPRHQPKSQQMHPPTAWEQSSCKK